MHTSTVKRDSELWFDDGNLILVTGNVEFKVYRGPLIAHSPIFKDMLSLPQPSEPDQSSENACPVIPLHDSADDLRHALRVFVPGNSLRSVAGATEPTYDEVAACIRIGHKYQIDELVQRNITFLQKLYPSDYNSFLATRRNHRPPSFTRAHAIGVVNLARLVNVPSLIPIALMECCTIGANIVHGLLHADGTREMLTPEDLGRCFVGRARMGQASARIAHQMFRQTVARGCRRPACCQRVLLRLLTELGDGRIELVSNIDWWASWTEYVDGKDEDRELCGRCYRMLDEDRPMQLQREVWGVLPTMMGLPQMEDWGEKSKVRWADLQ
ncbi:hypothetical protein C2E23DRAFT_722714 [Lenzites betulinus]|nr:hypothetical protein C2E23DRAFT_722714 [Lenzites betulinus]